MILIVDDRQENLFSLKKILSLNQFEVDTAESGEEALKKILKNKYELIILDVQMPGMDGFEVAETIKGYSKSRDIPIIFLSAVNTEKKFVTKGYTSGGIDYIAKPFDPDILMLKVKTFYKLQTQTNELNAAQRTLKEEIEYRKQAENNLSQSVDELRSILESIPHIAFTTTAEGKIEFINQKWYLYSYTKEISPETLPGELTLDQCIQKTIDSKRQNSFELSIKALHDTEYRYHTLTMTPVKKNDVITKWVCILTDIHEQKMATQLLEQRVIERTEQLRKINSALETSNHELQQFAYIASHDLKEPLRKIQFFSDLVRTRYLENGSEASSYMNRIILSSERMKNLITDVLEYSKLSIGAGFEKTNLNEIIQDILSDMELLITEKKAVIHVDQIPDIEANAAQMRQVFQNILSNALKFSKKDVVPEVNVHAHIENSYEHDGYSTSNVAVCKIEISDNGIGFNEAYLDKIFTIFQRLNSKEEYEGTGIGLAIVKKIIETHNGSITARSAEGKGSCFIIKLPLMQNTAIQSFATSH
ncbi:hybrid sensor histidine kinase/response regulator [Pinibacter aurantiacus]|uniref:histidine kinase n=1 Tax=Pinibacter aurantiacus TaxID=2851599 RepID=A0A9E2S887_9BACT|nr:response regulator [Pinibacter aurantiacus]MBV4355775.1 response regulator [Pinibacter aurantiacus]